MENDALIARLMKTFLGEAEEHVRTLNEHLLALEKRDGGADRAKTFKSLFRTAHSLKGAAHAVRLPLLEMACHKLEELFSAASDGRRSFDPELFRLLFTVVDGIGDAVGRLREQKSLEDAPLALMLPGLDAAIAGAPASLGERRSSAAREPAPAAAERFDQLVRIPAERLDALLAHSGELMVARRRAEMRSEDAERLHESVKHWRAEWRGLERAVERLLSDGNGPSEHAASPTAAGRPARATPRVLASTRRAIEDLRRFDRELQRFVGTLGSDHQALGRMAGLLDGDVRRARLLPFAEACVGLERVVRDLAATSGKEIDLVVEGADIELDRSILEGLKDPLLHLVRNSVDHGIESASARLAAGKPARGRIGVAAMLRGSRIEVTVADDGAGLDIPAIRERTRQKHLPEPADERECAQNIFLAGFSTSPIVTEISGRGVGLDAVKNKVESMRGAVELDFEAGRGVRMTLSLPLTLTTIRALLAECGGQIFAFDNMAVEKLLRIGAGELRSIDGRDVLTNGGGPTPVVALAELLQLRADTPSTAAGDRQPAMLLAAGGHRVVIRVDNLLAEQEVVVRGLGRRLVGLKAISGAAILPTGRLTLILNAADVVRMAVRHLPAGSQTAAEPLKPAQPRLLVADDSITTRMLEKSILESAGYAVLVAADGLEAWRLLQEHGADLVVSDVQMPDMDGFALTKTIRGSQRFRTLPVILVTGRESEADKIRGLEAGADAYLLKSAFDQTILLETIRQIL